MLGCPVRSLVTRQEPTLLEVSLAKVSPQLEVSQLAPAVTLLLLIQAGFEVKD